MTRQSPHIVPSLTTLGLASAVLLAAAACNVAPTGAVVAIGPDGATTTDDLVATLTTEPTDDNDDEVIVSYTWSVLGADGGDFFDRPEFISDTVPSTATTKGDTWQVIVNATDGEEAAPASDPATITILNTPPEASYARISPTAGVDTFGTLTASGAGTDIDNDDVELSYTWYVDGVALEADGTTLTGDNFGKNQEVWVEVTVNDGEADSEPVASEKVVIENTPPKLTGVVIDQEVIQEGTEVTCSPVGWYDADDDAPNVDATWLVNGAEVSTDAVLTGDNFDKGDLIRCAGVPNDGDSLGQLYLSPVVQVVNTAPTMTGAAVSNRSPGALEVLTAAPVGAVDVDGDDLTFMTEWYVQGEMVYAGDELPSRSFVKGDQVWAMLTPFDGLEYGEPVKSDVANAVNTAPEVTSVNLIPGEMYTDDQAYPEVVVEDVDGDSLTYTVAWTVNGSVVSHTGAALDGDIWFDKGDTISVEVIPTDGEDTGAAASSTTVEVLNSPPEGPAIYFDEDKVKDDVDLICVLDSDYFDADGDDLEYTFTWQVDGVDFDGAVDGEWVGDTISFEDTVDLEDWTCTLEVSDGDITVTSSATIEVRNWAGPRNFTTCGKSGYTGPSSSQCSSAYASSPILDDGLAVSGGIQTWTVPQDGTYRIEVWGANGGVGSYASGAGHKGARMRGDFDLTAGDELQILVGQSGSPYSYGYGAGGGGGSFVVDEDGTPLIVAAGGGANGYFYGTLSTCGGQSGTRSKNASSSSSYCYTAYNSSGSGGGYRLVYSYYTYHYGGGGAGFTGNGGHYSSSYAARSFTNGGYGGNFVYNDGGFGGGGAGGYRYDYGSSYYYGAGGGGGYTGGYGGQYQGGGGASYNTGANQSNSSANNGAAGKVTIDLAP